MKVYTIDNDAHTIAHLISAELIHNLKNASYRVPHPNSIKSQLVLYDGCEHKDLYNVCDNLLGILSDTRYTILNKFADSIVDNGDNSQTTITVSYHTAKKSIVTDNDIC